MNQPTHLIPSTHNERALWVVLSLTSLLLVVEVCTGFMFNSLALIADAGHVLTDVSALGIALAALRIAQRPGDAKRTYGYYRFEVLAAAFNALMLFGVGIYILYEAYERFYHPVHIMSEGLLIVAVTGLAVNAFCLWMLRHGKEQSINIKGAYLEVLSDMVSSIGVIIGALVIHLTQWMWVDTIIAALIGLWVLPRTWVLLKETMNILLEGVPDGMEVEALEAAMSKVPGVTNVHDIHVWSLTRGKASLTAHIMYDPHRTTIDEVIPAVQKILLEQFNVYHTTLQCETEKCYHTGPQYFTHGRH